MGHMVRIGTVYPIWSQFGRRDLARFISERSRNESEFLALVPDRTDTTVSFTEIPERDYA